MPLTTHVARLLVCLQEKEIAYREASPESGGDIYQCCQRLSSIGMLFYFHLCQVWYRTHPLAPDLPFYEGERPPPPQFVGLSCSLPMLIGDRCALISFEEADHVYRTVNIPFGDHLLKLEWIQRRLAWPLHKDRLCKHRSLYKRKSCLWTGKQLLGKQVVYVFLRTPSAYLVRTIYVSILIPSVVKR